MKPRHVDESSNRMNTETTIVLTKYSCKGDQYKNYNFWRSFSLKFSLYKQGSLMFLVQNQFKSFNVILVIRIEKNQWNCVTNRSALFVYQEVQQPITTSTSCDFSVCNYSFANKIDSEQKTIDLKLFIIIVLAEATRSVDI